MPVASFLDRRPTGTLYLLFRGETVETAAWSHELVLVVSLAFSETPPWGAGHAVQRSRNAFDVPQPGVARFRTSRLAQRRELVLIVSQAVASRCQGLKLRRARRPGMPSTGRRGPVVF